MSQLFSPFVVNGMRLANRFVRSATGESMAPDDGRVTDELIEIYRALAQGGCGLIITGHSFVRADGRAGFGMTGLDKDELIPGWKRLVQVVHETESKIAIQLNHAGRQTHPRIIGQTPVAPSPVPASGAGFVPRQLTSDEIRSLIDAFAAAARRAMEAGFDAVQIHCAHGYLLSEFISPHTNRRDDEWGGTEENRRRMLVETYRAIRREVGPGYPVLVKLNAEDFLDDGLTLDMSLNIARALEAEGIDAIEVSAGMAVTVDKIVRKNIRSPEDEAYFEPQVKAFRKAVSVPLIMVGGLRSRAVMERVLREGTADLVSLCRPFIREPDLANKFERGEIERVACVSCNLCSSVRRRGALRCIAAEKEAANHG